MGPIANYGFSKIKDLTKNRKVIIRPSYYSVNYETYICDGVEYPQIWANEVIIGPHIQPAGYFPNPAKLKNQP
jgi:hypothetical protein